MFVSFRSKEVDVLGLPFGRIANEQKADNWMGACARRETASEVVRGTMEMV
jgi:hypothetical protein